MLSSRTRNFHGNDTYNPDEDPLIAYEVLAAGKGMAAVASKLKICRLTVNVWRKRHPEFERAILQGLEASEEWWDEEAQKYLVTHQEYQGTKTTFDNRTYIFTKKVRFKARETDPVNVIAITGEESAEKLKELVAKVRQEEL